MIATLLAVTAIITRSSADTLAGVTLGSSVKQILSRNPSAERSGNMQRWSWHGDAGGSIAVTADSAGESSRVDFVADGDRKNSVDLPCTASRAFR